jgi:hypothetical protein
MDWQQLAALLIVAGTAGLLFRSKFRRRPPNFQAVGHCGCPGNSSISPQASIVFRARKGQRPEVRVRMK